MTPRTRIRSKNLPKPRVRAASLDGANPARLGDEISHRSIGLVVAGVVAGAILFIVGVLMVTDQLSLRGLLAVTGPEAARRLVLGLHGTIEHPGAQAVELAGALLGAALIVLSIRTRRRTGT